MDVWMHGLIDGYMDIWMYGWMDEWIDWWMDWLMDICMYGWMDGLRSSNSLLLSNQKFNLDTYGKKRFSVSTPCFMEQPSSTFANM